MPKSARDRIKYPGGEGFPRRHWSEPSEDDQIRTQPLVGRILDELGNLIDAIESADQRDFSHIEWKQLTGLRSIAPRDPNPALIASFIVDKADSIAAAYSGAVRRRYQEEPPDRIDLAASRELLDFYGVISSMFRKSSAENVLEQSLQNTKSLQDLIDLLERHSSKVVLSYQALYPENPTNSTSLNSATSLKPQLPAPGSLPSAHIHSSRRASWWERLKDKISRA